MINWTDYHAYRVFDEFIETFVIGKRSYITKHSQSLDFDEGLVDIKTRFIDKFDGSKDEYESKLEKQFDGASDNSKIIFSNAEYLWAMPTHSLRASTKQNYPRRWFAESELQSGDGYYFEEDHTVAGTGSYYTRHKFFELSAIVQLLTHLHNQSSLTTVSEVKRAVEKFSYNTIYGSEPSDKDFHIKDKCSIRNMLLHLSNPDKYESIVSYSDKSRIIKVFGYVLTDQSGLDVESKIKAIRSTLYPDYGNKAPISRKERWFFYQDDILPRWKGKSSSRWIETSIR